MKRGTVEEFIKKASSIHDNYYKYDKVIYNNVMSKVIVICPEHGDYEQRADHHLAGRRCKKCSTQRDISSIEKQKEKFISAAMNKWNGKYNYTKVNFIRMRDKVTISCPIHGDFEQAPDTHMKHECMSCASLSMGEKQRINIEDFIIRAREIHFDRYEYNKLIHTEKSKTKVEIVCPTHGLFTQEIHNHLNGKGCQTCGLISTGEKFVASYLDGIGVVYKREMTFDELYNDKTNSKLRIDFYIPDRNIAIEYDGKQHFEVVEFWGNTTETLKGQQYKDFIKTEYCKNNSIHLVRINYKMNRKKQLEILDSLFIQQVIPQLS